jgi:hypothetical protein
VGGTLTEPTAFVSKAPRSVHARFKGREDDCGFGFGTWRKSWTCAFCPVARSPPLLAPRCWPFRARPRPPSRCPRPRSSGPSPPRASSPSNGTAAGIMGGAGITAGIAGAGITAGIGGAGVRTTDGDGAIGTIMDTLLAGAAGGPRGGSGAADGSEARELRAWPVGDGRSSGTPYGASGARLKSPSSPSAILKPRGWR